MNILDIAIAKKLAGGGGGSGTDNYNDLSNLPKINDTTLSGNKSSSALGLQSEINSDSKLASDLVDDTNQDNKFVTASDKETWNAKQNAIDNSHKLSSDLVDDANHTNKFVTSTEKQTWNAKQNAIDADHKLSSSLVSFSTAETAALASGIDSSKVGQISTNQTNILSVQDAAKELADKGAKNLLPKLKSYTGSGLSMVINDDNSITAKWSATGDSTLYARINDNNWTLPRGTYVLSGMPNNSYIGCYIHIETNTSQLVVEQGRKTPVEFTIANDYEYLKIYISIRPNSAAETSGVTILPMIVTKAISDIGADSYIPPALPNYDLTQLEQQDRNALVEAVDKGAKNIFDITTPNLLRDTVVTPLSNGGATLSCNNAVWTQYGERVDVEVNKRYKVIVYIDSITGSVGTNFNVNLSQGSTFLPITPTNTGEYSVEVESTATTLDVAIFINNSETPKSLSINMRMMICTLADWKISQKFVPYRKNLDELEATKAPALDTGAGVDSGSLDDISKNTFAIYTTNVSNLPTTTSYYYVETSVFNSSSALQRAYDTGNGESYVRVKYQGTWSAWKQITNA